ncbi:MAG: 4-hydroxythreonine-4-phosphate dehydrogenase PdxA [Bacteroidota bacterium]
MSTPTIGLLSGDATGIGPEVIAKLFSQPDVLNLAKVVLIGDERVFQEGCRIAKCPFAYTRITDPSEIDSLDQPLLLLDRQHIDPAETSLGKVNAHVGKMVLEDFKLAMDLTSNRQLHALCFAPLNKQALRAGGNPFEDELHFFANHLGVTDFFCEINVMDDIWTTRATSHVALRDIFDLLTRDRIYQAIYMADHAMKQAGHHQADILVSALNPHGGENGLFGDEESTLILPAIQQAQKAGIRASGPFPADTIFLKIQAKSGVGVVSMYHDQGQVALKLMGFKRGVTVQGGLPIPITTPAHGTAFDIVGKGIADAQGMRLAFDLAVKMGKKRMGFSGHK